MSKREIIDHYEAGLLPCPLCGAKEAKNGAEAWAGGVIIREDHRPAAWDGAFPARVLYVVQCGGCGLTITRGTLEAAREIWNTRTP